MSKKAKIMLTLSILALLILLYIAATSESEIIGQGDESGHEAEREIISLDQIKENYKSEASKIMSGYLELVDSQEITVDSLKEARDRLLTLKLPFEFKQVHLDLILAFNKMENYLQGMQEAEKQASQQIIAEALANHEWLNK